MKWRKKWGVDSLLNSWKNPEVLEKYDIGGMSGYDKEGCPVWIYPSAKLDMKGMVNTNILLYCGLNVKLNGVGGYLVS